MKNILPPTGTQALIPQLLRQWPSLTTELPQFLHLDQTYSLSTNPPPENSLLCCAMYCATKTPAKVTGCCILFCDINILFSFHVQPQFISVFVLATESNLEEEEYSSSMFSLQMVDSDQNLWVIKGIVCWSLCTVMLLIMYMVNDETIHSSSGYVEGSSTLHMLGTYLLLILHKLFWVWVCVCMRHRLCALPHSGVIARFVYHIVLFHSCQNWL